MVARPVQGGSRGLGWHPGPRHSLLGKLNLRLDLLQQPQLHTVSGVAHSRAAPSSGQHVSSYSLGMGDSSGPIR